MSSSTTVTTTTTTTTTSSGFDDFSDDDDEVAAQYDQDDHYHMPGYNGRIGCSWPMETASFEEVALLLLRGKLPSQTELVAYRDKTKSLRGLR